MFRGGGGEGEDCLGVVGLVGMVGDARSIGAAGLAQLVENTGVQLPAAMRRERVLDGEAGDLVAEPEPARVGQERAGGEAAVDGPRIALRDGLKQPFMFLLSDHGSLEDPGAREVFAKIQSIYNRLPAGRQCLILRGANHFSFSDQILLKSAYLVKLAGLFQGGLNARRGLALTAAYVHTFFDVYLKNAPPGLLDRLRENEPAVQCLMAGDL